MKLLRAYFIILFFCFAKTTLFSQKGIVDSLKIALKNSKHDSTKIEVLLIWGEEMYQINSDSALLLWHQAQSIAESRLKDFSPSDINSKYLCRVFSFQLAAALNNIGIVNDFEGHSPEALDYFKKSVTLHENLLKSEVSKLKANEIEMAIATTFNNMGFIYENQGDIPVALGYYHKGLRLREGLLDKTLLKGQANEIKKGVSASLVSIGYTYSSQGDMVKALEYYNKSLKIGYELEDKEIIANSLSNLASVYNRRNDLPKAFEYYQKSLEICYEIQHKQGAAYSLNNIGTILMTVGDPSCKLSKEKCIALGRQAALGYFKQSLRIREEIKDKQGIVYALKSIAELLLLQDRVEEAKSFSIRGLVMAKELGFPDNIRSTSEILYKIYKKQNKYTEALQMHQLFIQMRDSINNKETQKASTRQQFKYEYEKKELTLRAEQEKKDLTHTDQNKRQKIIIVSIITGLFLVIVFLGFLFNRFKIAQKQKKIIEQQKSIVDEAYSELHEKNKEVTDSIHYAKRIQTALITNEKYFERNLNRLIKG